MLFFTRFYPRFFSSALLFIRAISHPRDFSSAHFIRASFIRASSFAHLHPRTFASGESRSSGPPNRRVRENSCNARRMLAS
jgi:hypothetical protein